MDLMVVFSDGHYATRPLLGSGWHQNLGNNGGEIATIIGSYKKTAPEYSSVWRPAK